MDLLVRYIESAGRRFLLGLILVVMASTISTAQTILDPRLLQFSASPDHYAIDSNGSPLIDRYELSLYDVDTSTWVNLVDLGKPAPATDGTIRVDLISALPTWALAGGVAYAATVNAVGSFGSAPSLLSNMFSFNGPCAFSLSPGGASFGATGGQGSISVGTGSTCQWSASSAAPWIAVSASGGSGAQSVTYTVSPNTSAAGRVGTLALANTTFTVSQAGVVSCTYGVTANMVAFPATGGHSSATIATLNGCGWTVTPSAPWMTADLQTGSGPQAVGYTVAANTSSTPRSGSLNIAGTVVTLSQAGAPAPPPPPGTNTITDPHTLEFLASPDHFVVDSSSRFLVQGYELEIYQTSPEILYSVLFLGKPAPDETGTVHVDLRASLVPVPPAGITYEARVSAVGAATASSAPSNPFAFSTPCTYTLSSNATSFGAPGGQGSLTVSSGANCAWSVSGAPSWITPVSQGGTGSQTLAYSVAANTTTSSRTAALTVANTLVTISQAGIPCSFNVGSSTTTFGANGGSSSANVTTAAGCGWSASSPVPWVSLDGTTRSGSQSVAYTVSANTSPSPRTTTVTIANASVAISQAGLSCSYAVSSSNNTFPASGGSGSIGVTTSAGCAWTETSSAAWISPAASTGSGTQTIAFSVAPNTSSSSRTGSITLAGTTVAITQGAAVAPCAFSLGTLTTTVDWKPGTYKVSLQTGASCSWTATDNASWLTVTPASGTGNASISYSVTRNPNSSPRQVSVNIGGQTLTVTQRGK